MTTPTESMRSLLEKTERRVYDEIVLLEESLKGDLDADARAQTIARLRAKHQSLADVRKDLAAINAARDANPAPPTPTPPTPLQRAASFGKSLLAKIPLPSPVAALGAKAAGVARKVVQSLLPTPPQPPPAPSPTAPMAASGGTTGGGVGRQAAYPLLGNVGGMSRRAAASAGAQVANWWNPPAPPPVPYNQFAGMLGSTPPTASVPRTPRAGALHGPAWLRTVGRIGRHLEHADPDHGFARNADAVAGAALSGAVATGNPVAIGVAALAKGATASAAALQKWTVGLMEGSLKFAEFSGAMSVVAANARVQDIFYSQARGEARAGSTQRLNDSYNRLRNASAPLADAGVNVAQNALSGVLGSMAASLLTQQYLLTLWFPKFGKWLSEMTMGESKGDGTSVTNWLEDAVNAKYDPSTERPPRFR